MKYVIIILISQMRKIIHSEISYVIYCHTLWGASLGSGSLCPGRTPPLLLSAKEHSSWELELGLDSGSLFIHLFLIERCWTMFPF